MKGEGKREFDEELGEKRRVVGTERGQLGGPMCMYEAVYIWWKFWGKRIWAYGLRLGSSVISSSWIDRQMVWVESWWQWHSASRCGKVNLDWSTDGKGVGEFIVISINFIREKIINSRIKELLHTFNLSVSLCSWLCHLDLFVCMRPTVIFNIVEFIRVHSMWPLLIFTH